MLSNFASGYLGPASARGFLFSCCINIFLLGSSLCQLYEYFQRFPSDQPIFKALTALLGIINFVDAICLAHLVDFIFIKRWGNRPGLEGFFWQFDYNVVCLLITSVCVQLFYAWRLSVLTRPRIWPVVVVICLAMLNLGVGIATLILVFLVPAPTQVGSIVWVFTVNLIVPVITDCVIAGLIGWRLSNAASAVKEKNAGDVIQRVIRLTFESNGITAACGIICSLLFIVNGLLVRVVLSKVYFFAYLWTMNSRVETVLQLENVKAQRMMKMGNVSGVNDDQPISGKIEVSQSTSRSYENLSTSAESSSATHYILETDNESSSSMASAGTVPELSPDVVAAIQKSLGAAQSFLIATLCAWFVAGINLHQTWVYFRFFKSDHWAMKAFVITVVIVAAVDTCLLLTVSNFWLIDNFGSPPALDSFAIGLPVHPALLGILTLLVQLFYAYRIYILSRRSIFLPGFVVILAALGCAAGVWTACHLYSAGAFSRDHGGDWVKACSLFLPAAADAVILVSMVVYLREAVAEAASAEDSVLLFNRLWRVSLETNFVTMLLALLSAVLLLVAPAKVYLPIPFVIGQVYQGCCLYSLNSRLNTVVQPTLSAKQDLLAHGGSQPLGTPALDYARLLSELQRPDKFDQGSYPLAPFTSQYMRPELLPCDAETELEFLTAAERHDDCGFSTRAYH
ncbi:hypothetical protein E5Q_04679 [Mixia osmundae IAM 14324]|uniref:DUF6534 domain-containing protein n=1 Tax=Mixia osmundae (strain CBS 9802 / IAM 14324 / JCM 22182 / KY 12970) TaxID=764103 RepID=G7E589_MIXOS|nr:hypothetical protein E5Q_04679 [Mixia osmundae IAM 14324]